MRRRSRPRPGCASSPGDAEVRFESEREHDFYDIQQPREIEDLGPIAQPSEIEVRPALPKTRSGKIVRRLLKAQEMGEDPGDLSTLAD